MCVPFSTPDMKQLYLNIHSEIKPRQSTGHVLCINAHVRALRQNPTHFPPAPGTGEPPPLPSASGQSYVITPRRTQGPAAAMVQLGSRLLKGYRGGHVVIRLALGGCTNRPFYRLVAAHSRRARDGKYLEQLGCLDPLPNSHGEKVAGLNLERLRHWLGCGAQLSRPAEKLLGLAGFLPLHPMTVTGAERLRRRRALEAAARPEEGSAAARDGQ
uniref:Small ribosomal subunit protein bS16m n=2 Tax=Melopsittacus undulatus TaxID=13146 RepID=A0A8V5HFJ1_MELUD